MKQYFDFNSFEKSIRKSLFEGIDLDDETEDVQFEKTVINNDFKREQHSIMFRMMIRKIMQPVVNNPKYVITPISYSSYIKDGQEHYTYAFSYQYKDVYDLYHNYLFDYCFETNNFLIFNIINRGSSCVIDRLIIDIITKCEYPINIYYGIYVDNIPSDVYNILKRPIIPDDFDYISINGDSLDAVPHKFFDKFKGFISKCTPKYEHSFGSDTF